MATIKSPNISFKEWAKDSRTATTMFMCSLVVFLMYMLTGSQTKRVDDCKDEILYLRQRDSIHTAEINFLKEQQYGSASREQETVKYLDSLLHAKTEKQARRILKSTE